MFVNSLTMALAAFQQNNVRVIDVNKSHPAYYHVYYKKDGNTRVMLVPKHSDEFQTIQREVETLVSRDKEEQLRIGMNDGKVSNA